MTGEWRKSGNGYLRLRISGGSIERFLNLCSANGLEPWDLQAEDGCVECSMGLRPFRLIRPLARKAGVHMRIVGRYGLPFFIYRNRKREGAVCGLLAFAGLLYAFSLFVWNITFEGNYHYSRDTLMGHLETLDIRCGMRKSGISCEDLEESLRSTFPEITWVSASVMGTRLIVRIKENEVLSSVPEKDDSPCELAAARSGTVTRMVVRQGRACVSVGDRVEKGQLLVASGLSVKNDAGEVIRTKYVRADADVYAQTDYSYRVEFPRFCRQEIPTGRVRREYLLMAGMFRARLQIPAKGELAEGLYDGAVSFAVWLAGMTGLDRILAIPAQEKTETFWKETDQMHQLCLFEDFFLPVYWVETESDEYTFYERSHTMEEVRSAAARAEEKYLENLCEKGVHIIENNVKILEYGAGYLIEGTVKAEEEIVSARSVEAPETPGEE